MAILLAAALASPARANTLTFGGVVSASGGDRTYTPVAFDENSPTSCGDAVTVETVPGPVLYDAYAFRNAAGAADCITVDYTLACDETTALFSSAYSGWFDPTSSTTNFAGDDAFCGLGLPESTYGFLQPSSPSTFIVVVNGAIGHASDEESPYTLNVSGTNVVAAQSAQATATLPRSNTLSLHASSLPDGSAVEGTLSDHDASGHAYSGPVRCLRISGRSASLVMTFDGTQTGLPASSKGAVYWLHQGTPNVDSDGQRNSVLTQRQLDGRYAACPDPTAPPGGTFKPIADGDVSVITDPAAP